MNLRKITSILLIFVSSAVFAQGMSDVINVSKNRTDKEVLDSIKATFEHDEIASCIDSLWMQELTSLDVYDELSLDIKNIDVDEKVEYNELTTSLLKKRLKEMDEKSPFRIEYNEGLENIIKSFLKNRKRSFERLMGVSQYYFPLFEESLAARNIPLEIKYLAVVESALNPRAVSRVGATGLWQFMYQTGLQYDLKVNSYVDERRDPVKASKAATQYMENMYKIFGDWDLVLASYNSGPGNVSKAIRRSGGKQNYWNIRKYLPKETQGYLPAFLATMYIFEYHKEHGIQPDKAIANRFATDTVMVKNALTFKQISKLLDIPVAEIQFLNPIYKLEEIPYVNGENHYLRLPVDKIAVFTSNEEKIYAYVKYLENKLERPYTSAIVSNSSSSKNTRTSYKYHKIKRGESLGSISNKYGVSVADLRNWNGIRGNHIVAGATLKVSNKDNTPKPDNFDKQPILNENSTNEAVVEHEPISKDYYEVKKGDNLFTIAKKFNISVEDIKKWNNLDEAKVDLGSKIVLKEESKTEENHEAKTEIKTVEYKVQKGDNLTKIAQKNNVTVSNLKEWNGIESSNVMVGQNIIVSKKEVALIEIKTEKKETASSKDKSSDKLYYVQKGDSLFSIAKQFPGVSISDLKKWNGIKSESLKPGMKLKISG